MNHFELLINFIYFLHCWYTCKDSVASSREQQATQAKQFPFMSSIRATYIYIYFLFSFFLTVEAASKPFDTAEKLTVTGPWSVKMFERLQQFGNNTDKSNKPYILIVQSTLTIKKIYLYVYTANNSL